MGIPQNYTKRKRNVGNECSTPESEKPILVEMEDGEYVVCCRYAVREIKTANSVIANSYCGGSSEELSLSTLFS